MNNNIHPLEKVFELLADGMGYNIGNAMLFGDEGMHVVDWQEWYFIYIPNSLSKQGRLEKSVQ